MIRASRRMPPFMPAPESRAKRLRGYLVIAVFLGGYACSLWAWPSPMLALSLLLALVVLVERRRYKRHIRAIIESRPGESVCTFVRAVAFREIDTRVVRAVFEQLQNHVGDGHAPFPIRPSDRLTEDLRIDDDELELEVANEIAQRSARDLSETRSNPYYGKVVTVEDLIRFFCAQPRNAT